MTDCPTRKIAYRSRSEALVATRGFTSQPAKSGQLHPYLCVCGQWHLTSMTKRAYKRATRRRA